MTSAGSQERYTMGFGKSHDLMNTRTTGLQAGFFTPHIRPGMRLLDCGSGPGSITLGLGEIVSPGKAVGIDIAENQVERATELARESGISNVSFQKESVYELPFPDESFDAVFANAVLEHLDEPLKALLEMKRVMKPGGVVGVRDTDQGSHVYPKPLMEYLAAVQKLWKHNGGNPFIGRDLKPLLVKAGFVSAQGSATFDWFGTADSVEFYAEMHQSFIKENNGSRMVELGIATQAEVDAFYVAFGTWSKQPDAFAAVCYCEALGWKA